MKPNNRLHSLLALAGSSLIAISSASAQLYWDTNSTATGFGTASGTWGIDAFWNTDTAGEAGTFSTTSTTSDALNFGNGATGLESGTIAVDGTVASGNMTFASGSGAITLSGGTINLAAATSITVNNSTNTLASDITGAATSLTKAGTGTLIFSGAHTRSGTSAITGGRLIVRSGTLGTGAIVWATNNTTLQFQSDSNLTVGNTWTTSGRNLARTLVVDRLTSGDASDLTYTFSSQFLIDTNSNLTFSAGSNVTSGTPTVNFGGGIRSSDSNTTPAITLTPNGVNVRANGFSNTRGRIITLAGTSVGNEIYGVITQNATHVANILKSGTSTWTLSGANTYVGTTTITNGILKFAKQTSLYNNAAASWTAGNLNVKSGGTLAFNVGGTGEFTTGNVTTLLTNLADSSGSTVGMNSGSNFGFDTSNASGGTFTIADVIANSTGASGGDRGLTKHGAGTLELTNTNTYTGATTVNAGTLELGVDNCLANTNVEIGAGALKAAANVNDSVGTLDVTHIASTINLGSGATLVFTASNGVDWTGGKLNITGTFVPGNGIDPGVGVNPGSLRFGTNNTGLDGGKFPQITASGWTGFGIDAYGFLTATPGGGSAYDAWKADNAPGSNPDDDTDGDGVLNAVEFVLGGTSATRDLDKLPVPDTDGTNMTFIFKRKQSSIDPKTSLMIETSTDLATWNITPSPYTVPDVETVGPPVKVAKGVPATFDTVTLTVPKAPDAKKFARLKVVITP